MPPYSASLPFDSSSSSNNNGSSLLRFLSFRPVVVVVSVADAERCRRLVSVHQILVHNEYRCARASCGHVRGARTCRRSIGDSQARSGIATASKWSIISAGTCDTAVKHTAERALAAAKCTSRWGALRRVWAHATSRLLICRGSRVASFAASDLTCQGDNMTT
jgi:hypothetical protein